MDVKIVEFPETKVAVIEHVGPASLEHETVKRLISWKLENGLLDSSKHRSYGIHYTDPKCVPPSQHRVDFCVSVETEVETNSLGVISKIIPSLRCAFARDVGSRYNNKAAAFLQNVWLPKSGEVAGGFPMFFHYLNVGPKVREEDMITDVYLPLK